MERLRLMGESRRAAGASGTETGRFNQAHLVATGGEFTTLVALHHNAATGFDADHPGAHPTEGG